MIGSKSLKKRLIGSGYDFSFKQVNPESKHGGATHNFQSAGRPMFVIHRSISIVPSVPADDHCNVCVTQSCQLVCLLDQVRSSSGELLRFCFGRVQHLVDLFDRVQGQQWVH